MAIEYKCDGCETHSQYTGNELPEAWVGYQITLREGKKKGQYNGASQSLPQKVFCPTCASHGKMPRPGVQLTPDRTDLDLFNEVIDAIAERAAEMVQGG